MASLYFLDIFLGGLGLYILKRILAPKAADPPLPPGPKRKPLIGNLLDLPPPGEFEWIHWLKHKDLYGPISSVSVFGQNIIILNDLKLAVDLLEKKSSIYSDRPVLVFGGIMCGWENSLPLLRYGDRFKTIRRNLQQFMGSGDAIARHHPLEEIESRRFLLRMLKTPGKLSDHIRTLAGGIILKMSHGYTIEPEKPDPLVELADDVLLEFSLSAQPGTWLVDVMPFLRHIPDWFPGTSFKRIAQKWKSNADQLVDQPHAFTKQQMKNGMYYPSITSKLLEKAADVSDEFAIKWTAAAVYGGGADTTVSANYSFFLAMTLYPEVQKRAQEELDRIIGNDRLPSFSDRKNLPYINAIVKESLRWNPVVPLGLPHVPTEDGIVNGYLIPKGSIIMANIWQFSHDSSNYHDPSSFKPERFLGENPEYDSHNVNFGFGRRICPGKELADASLFIAFAMSLAVFNIRKAKDANGKDIEPLVEYTNGIISRPKEYVCSVLPRSQKALELIKSVEEDHPFEPSDSQALFSLDWRQSN